MAVQGGRLTRRRSHGRDGEGQSRPAADGSGARPRDHRAGRPRTLRLGLHSAAVAETVSTNQFKNGMHIELDGSVWRIVEFQHVKPGKGGAFVRTKLKAPDSGAVADRTFRAGAKVARVPTEATNA